MTILNIVPYTKPGVSKTGTLKGLTKQDVEDKLGFAPNVEDDPVKVTASWGFKLNPEPGKENPACGIWDYKGSGTIGIWSTYGPSEVFEAIFGEKYVKGF